MFETSISPFGGNPNDNFLDRLLTISVKTTSVSIKSKQRHPVDGRSNLD